MNEIEKIITPEFLKKVKSYLPIYRQNVDMSVGSVTYEIIASTVLALLEQK